MWQKFRTSYPQGSLVSELVEINNGQYIVRVLVSVEGVTLASGLAAANTVEEAEDKARDRALMMIFLPEKISIDRAFVASKSVAERSTTKYSSSVKEIKLSEDINNSTLTKSPPQIFLETEQEVKDERGETETILFKEKIVNLDEDREKNVPETTTKIDIVDVIAKTDIELKKLGWTSKQGRDFLLQHYGKQSRHVLTDEELLDFLTYLQSQSLP